MRKRMIALLLVFAILFVPACGIFDDFEESPEYEVEEEYEYEIEEPDTEEDTPASNPQPVASGGRSGQADWLVLFYMDADDEVLEKDIFTDFNEAERVGSTDRVTLVAQIDRYDGGFDGDGDWTSTKRFYITQDPDLTEIHSDELEDLGELNMADGDTLVDFVTWAMAEYPADKVALILSDHGMGWPGIATDPDPGGNGDDDVMLAEYFGDTIWLMELDEALQEIRSQTGLEKFELIGFDACLMSTIEVLAAVQPHARYEVASQEVEPALGWAYASFLIDLAFDPNQDGADLARSIVASYIVKDERITDDVARQEFVEENLSVSRASAAEVAKEMSIDITLSAIDLGAIPDLMTALDELAYAMSETDQDYYAEARAYAQSFETPLDEDLPSPYIDLGHFVSIVMEENISDEVNQAGQAVLDALEQAVIAEKHGEDRPAASGISLYFPVYDLYNANDNFGYAQIAGAFIEQSQWDEYLDFHFTNASPDSGQWDSLNLWASGDEGKSGGRAGAVPLMVDPIELSGDVASEGSPVTLSTVVSGKQLAYIYVFMGLVSDDETILFIQDIDYLDAGETRQVNGVFFPEWGGETVDIEYDFEPIIYAIRDGVNEVPALLMPEEYGEESSVYSVEGYYTFAASGKQRFAKLYFKDEVMFKVVTFSNPEGAGAPYTTTPQKGDTFTVIRQGLYLEDNAPEDDYAEAGGVLTFGDHNFTWVEIPAPAGIYVVGIIAEDFDGKQYSQFEVVEVE
jgi:hypothetical protein